MIKYLYMSKFNIRIKDLRIEKGLSTQQMATDFSVTVRTIQRWEIGETEPRLDVVIELAKYFGVSSDYLLGITDVI